MRPVAHALRPCLALALVLSAVFAYLPAGAEEERRVIVHIEKQARSSGTITFHFTPTEGETEEVVVEIAKKMKTKGIAQAVMGALANVVDEEEFKVNMKDEQKINVEGRYGNTFELSLGEVTVDGISVFIRNP